MADATLFEVPDRAGPAEKLSADRRRTMRQAQAVAAGVHPLALVFGASIRMHPLADRTAAAGDGTGQPYRCGSCRFRSTVAGQHEGRFPKCLFGAENPTDSKRRVAPPRFSNGAATDVRAWWPACTDYSAADPRLSPDAARCLPDGGDR